MEYKITTEHCGKEYEHGTIEAVRVEDVEFSVTVDLAFVTTGDQVEEMKKEIQEVVRKYAI